MKIVRSGEEQIVSAHDRYLYGQNNNLYYNQQSDGSCAYDAEVDFSYSDKQFVNELAKDRQFGTSNIRPLSKGMNSFTERMYQDAIEESSRIKTMGYYNQFPDLKPSNGIHNSSIHNKPNSNIHVLHNNIKKDAPKDDTNIPSPPGNMSFSNDTNNNNKNIDFIDIKDSNIGFNFENNNAKPNEYDTLLNQVQNNIKQEIETRLVEEGREKLRQETKVQANNIPYRKTKEYESCDKEEPNNNQQLQVRNYKKSKEGTPGESNMSIGKWLLSIPFLLMPIIGFLVSGIISILVPKDKGFKIFTRLCLIGHMLASIACVYMFYSGRIDINAIKLYIFNHF